MEVTEDFFKTICRVCLMFENSDSMVTLTDISSSDGLSCYGKAVYIFTNISIKDDNLPNKMCSKCLLMLKQAILFRKTCENSSEKLSKFVRKCDPSKSDFKEKLSEYIMFMDTFPKEYLLKTSKTLRDIKPIKKSIRKSIEFVKNESFEMDFDSNIDFEDLFPLDCKYEKTTEETEYDVECLLSNMEIVAELKPKALKMYRKKYPKKKNQCTTRATYEGQKKNKQNQSTDKRKRKQNISQSDIDLQCKICMKVLANPDSYQAHMQRHSGGQYICEQCGRTFVTNAELKYHLACSHDIGAQYICKECGFKAPKKYELMEHERLHTGERPYACDKCGLTFRTRYIWKKHALYHMEKTIQCQQCPRKFHVKGELIAHVNGVHERMYIYACSQCDVTYAKTGTVRRHMVEKHGIPREMQGKIKRINLGKTSNVWNSAKGRPTLLQND